MAAKATLVTICVATMLLGGCGSDADSKVTSSAGRDEVERPTQRRSSSFFDLFGDNEEDQKIGVNRYLWAASLDTLSILPISSADPFSGVIATDWGRVNGASQPYRVTVYITEPALEARSLRVAVFRQSGGRAIAVSDDVAKEIENAILTRARQIRVAEAGRRS
ncbi:DUF3576 domain-containing protein [Algicella marina]|uniref:DUF3576 domain-containing protein n=1 Tax=Algicella marina TaxID=2683284 RepID=A0A6P1T4J1_9RHOB|nr:DUF3576 domain-containing protein [Algicella marina]QHQ36613.1 DUF3576 domain-containing protein [Algicella marina]